MPQPQPLLDPGSLTALKWTGLLGTLALLLLIGAIAGWTVALLALLACFTTLILCVATETEGDPR